MSILGDLQRQVQRGAIVPRSPLAEEGMPPEEQAPVTAPPVQPEPEPPSPAAEPPAMTPATAAALRKKYEGSGHTQTMTFDDWYDANFADSKPEEVDRAAAATPRIQAGRNPNLPAGEASGLAKSRIAAGKPIPEGRDIRQYSPDQRRTMQRNVHTPEVPMQRFGGTFTQNVDGSVSSRAPNPQALRDAEAIAAEQGPGSASHTMALAQAYGIDATQYGDDMDLLKADVMREKERHDRLSGKYDIVDNGMGGFRYKPNSTTNEMVQRRKNIIRLDEYGQRFAGMLSPEQEQEMEAELEAMGASPNDIMRLRRNRGTAQAVRNNWANRNMTIAMNNPRVAQGLYMRSLQEAARSGDPLQVAAVHESFGNERAAADYRNLAGIQSQVAGQALTAEANARASEEEVAQDTTLPKALSEQLSDALAIADPVQREIAIKLVLAKSGYPSDQIDAVTRQIVQSASGGAPAPTQSLWQWLFGGGGQQQPQQQAATPTAPTAAPAAVPPSGRGAMLNWATSGGPPAPDPNHPYRRGR